MLTRIINFFKTKQKSTNRTYGKYKIKADFDINLINKNALDIVFKLQTAGFECYLVGGCVRDLLLNIKPKDFDVATNATPEQIKKIFKRSARIIGRRFKIVHIGFGDNIIEIATFRTEATNSNSAGRILADNKYGSLSDDVHRRDFSVNALYYNPQDDTIIDIVQGIEDINSRTLRILGDAKKRYKEDPVRMLRAIRLSVKLNLTIESSTANPIKQYSALLQDISNARLYDECNKMFFAGYALQTFKMLENFGLSQHLFPGSYALNKHVSNIPIVHLALQNTDQRISIGKSINPAFLFSVILWQELQHRTALLQNEGQNIKQAYRTAIIQTIQSQSKYTAIPKRLTDTISIIWDWHMRLIEVTRNQNIDYLLSHPKFRAAYDFLLLRFKSGETHLQSKLEFWQQYQVAIDDIQKQELLLLLQAPNKKRNNRRKKTIKEDQ